MTLSSTFKKLFIYLVIFVIFLIGFYLVLKFYNFYKYNPQALEYLMTGPSRFRYQTDDPCFFNTKDNPTEVGNNYFTLRLHCNQNSHSFNVLALSAIKKDSYLEAIKELSRMGGFKIELTDTQIQSLGNLKNSDQKKWTCYIHNNDEVPNLSINIQKQTTLNCFYGFTKEEAINFHD